MDAPEHIDALLAAYRATWYDVLLADNRLVTIHVGQPPPREIAEWIGNDDFATVLSPCNPRSRPLPVVENAYRMADLHERLHLLPHRLLEGIGHIPGKRPQEANLLLAGMDLSIIDALARDFAQNAVVIVPAQGTARLRIYRAEWHAIVGTAPDLDWTRT